MAKPWTLSPGITEISFDLDVVSDEDRAHVLHQIALSGRDIKVTYWRSSELKHPLESHRCKDCFS